MNTLVIARESVRHNTAQIKAKAGSAVIYGVLTGDAHGAGLVEMARLLRDEGINRFAVSDSKDVITLRNKGFVEQEILMLRSLTDPQELESLMDTNVVYSIGSAEAARLLNQLAAHHSTVLEAHIQVDTGLGYGGLLCKNPGAIVELYRTMPNLAISGLYTQMHTLGGRKSVQEQLASFAQVTDQVSQAGFDTGTVHAAGSEALMRYEFAKLDGVRVGSAFLGRIQNAPDYNLQRVGFGEAPISEVRWLPKGHTVGIQRLITLAHDKQVGILPVGYQNGLGVRRTEVLGFWGTLLHWFTYRATVVMVNGQKAKVLGQVGEFETLIDLTGIACKPGDMVSFPLNPLFAKGFRRMYR